jgi:hypothetical protein
MAVNKAQMGQPGRGRPKLQVSIWGSEDHYLFQGDNWPEIDVTLLLPETGFLLVGEFFT